MKSAGTVIAVDKMKICHGAVDKEARIGKREGTAELDPPVVHSAIGSQTSSEARQTSRPVQSKQDSKENNIQPATHPDVTNSVDKLLSLATPKLLNIIGKRCLVHCCLNDITVEALWDTGAQASIINADWRERHLPHTTVRPIEVQTCGVSVTPHQSKRPSEWDPPIKLEHLTESQQQIVRQLLKEECNAFAFDDNDVRCIPSLNMHITLHDKSPVQKTYISVPKPLLQEVRSISKIC